LRSQKIILVELSRVFYLDFKACSHEGSNDHFQWLLWWEGGVGANLFFKCCSL